MRLWENLSHMHSSAVHELLAPLHKTHNKDNDPASPWPPLLAEHAVQHDARLAGQCGVNQLVHCAVVCKIFCLHVDGTLDVAAREVLQGGWAGSVCCADDGVLIQWVWW